MKRVPHSSTSPCRSLLRPPRARTTGASVRSTSRSSAISSTMPGRCTLTATSRVGCASPPASPAAAAARTRQRYTCPRLAAATGAASASSMPSSERSAAGPSSAAISARACSVGKAGTRSCSCLSASTYVAGTRSERLDATCPALMSAGPSATSASRRRAALTSSPLPSVAAYVRPTTAATLSSRRATRSGRRRKYAANASGSYRAKKGSSGSARGS
mmetsp:Transcript_4989/g.19897  ORF Transcript_4989/g.19897 Transcript_4989/m.19897 type:complete len:217 (-) Transcript_4989:45-695(-)